MGWIARALLVAMAVMLASAQVAVADTLPQRASGFTPAQAPGDQYTTPPATPPQTVPPAVAAQTPGARPGEEDEEAPEAGVGAEEEGAPPVEGQGPATVETGATAPRQRAGTLPFTGSDLLMLVWIALALLVAGTLIEVARRRYEAVRGRTGV